MLRERREIRGGKKGGEAERGGGGDAAKMVVMGYNVGIIDKRREEKGKEDRGRGDKRAVENSRRKRKRLCVTYNEEKEEDSNNNSLVLSLYSDKFPSRRGAGAPAGAGPDDKPPPPGSLRPWLFMIRELIRGSQLGLFLGRRRHSWDPVTTSNGATLSRPTLPLLCPPS